MEIIFGLAALIGIVLAIIISSFPLFLAVNFLGGDASFLKVFFTNIIVAGLSYLLVDTLGIGSLLFLLITIVLYKFIFSLGIIRAALAWVFQYVIAALLVILFILILGLF